MVKTEAREGQPNASQIEIQDVEGGERPCRALGQLDLVGVVHRRRDLVEAAEDLEAPLELLIEPPETVDRAVERALDTLGQAGLQRHAEEDENERREETANCETHLRAGNGM